MIIKGDYRDHQRDLLKVDTAILGSAFAAPLLYKAFEFFGFPSSPMETVIFEKFNLTPNQVEVKVKTGSHVLVTEAMKEIEIMRATIVTGEFSSYRTNYHLSADPSELEKKPDTRDYCRQAGIGASPKETADHARNLQSLIKNGTSIVTLDADTDILAEIQHPQKSYYLNRLVEISSIGALTSAGVIIALESLKKKPKKKSNINNVKKYASIFVLLGGTVASTLLLSQSKKNSKDCAAPAGENSANIETLGRNMAVEKAEGAEIEFEKYLNLVNKLPVMGYNEGLVKVRNLEMAYHLWRLIALSVGKDQDGIKIYSHHGSSHGEIEDLTLQGPEALQNQLLTYIRRVGNLGNYLNDQSIEVAAQEYAANGQLKNSTYANLYDSITELAKYINFFQEVNNIGNGSSPTLRETEVPYNLIPPSAKTLMFRNIIENIEKIGSEKDVVYTKGGFLKTALMTSLAYTSSLESKLNKSKNELIGKAKEEKIVGQLDFDRERVLWFDQYMAVNLKPDSFLIDGRLMVGCMEVNGRICPIVREFGLENEKIIAEEKLLLGPEEILVGLNKRIYDKASPANLPNHTTGVSLSSGFGKLATTDLDFFQKGNYPSENTYWYQGEDPAKFRILTLK